MANSTSISTPIKGMNQDLHGFNMDSKSYSYALNAVVGDLVGNEYLLQNEQSNILKAELPEGYRVIGVKQVPEKELSILCLVDGSGNSEIGIIINKPYYSSTDIEQQCVAGDCTEYYNKEQTPLEKVKQTSYCVYETIVSSKCLGFNLNYPVDLEYRVTPCGLNIYFTDNLNPRRFLYLDGDTSFTVQQGFFTITGYDPANCDLPIYSTELDCNKLNYNPCFTKPCIEFIDTGTDGQLKAGSYQFLLAYTDKNGTPLTNYFPACHPIPIFDRTITVETDYPTSKSITIDINNLSNTTFLYYNLVVAEAINGYTEFKLVGTFPTSFNTKDRYTYTGNDNTLKKLTSTDIFFRRPYYSTAKSITKANNYLFFSGVTEYSQLNLQRVANKVKLYWQTAAIPEDVYSDPRNTFFYKTYQRDEVYSFGIVFEFCDGWETCAFHIPGNSAQYFINSYGVNPLGIVSESNPDIITDSGCAQGTLNKYWQVNNTATIIPSLCEYKFSETCADNSCWESGDFGYYESTENYPNNPLVWGELCGTPIRHHKFPDASVTHIHDSKCGSKQFNETNIVYPIGVRVDHLSVKSALMEAVSSGIISQEDSEKIVSYRIVRGNRSGHKSIIAKGLLYDMWAYEKDSKTYLYANYPYNDLNDDYFISGTSNTYDQDSLKGTMAFPNTKAPIPTKYSDNNRYTFHSPDTHFNNPTLGNILKLETAEYGKSEGFFNHCEEEAKHKRLTFFSRLLALGMGVAAALSATEAKDCVTYTIKSDYKTKVNNYDIEGKGEMPVGIVSGAGSAISTVVAQQPWSGTSKVPDITSTQDNSVCLAHNSYDTSDGTIVSGDKNTIMTAASDAVKKCGTDDNVVEQYTRTTCTGTTHQLLSLNTDNKVMKALNSLFTVFTGAVSGPQVIQQVLLGMREMDIVLNLMKSLIPFKNYAIQYNSVGRYNNYSVVPSGLKQRKINRAAYLSPTVQFVQNNFTTSFADNTLVNNWNRESSVYLDVKEDGAYNLIKPHNVNSCVWQDNSRVTMGKYGMGFSYKELNKKFTRDISSFYGSIKNHVPDQYGKITNVEYLETNSCSFKLSEVNSNCSYTVFGGDTFINRFGLKRKIPFFLQSRFKQIDGIDVIYSELGNVGYPNYYLDTEKALFDRFADASLLTSLINPLSLLDEVVGLEDSRLDVKSPQLFWQKGYMYLYSYGIPYFFVESDINLAYRHAENNYEKDFYPNHPYLEDWFQEKNVPIKEDNYYFYNRTYSKQNKESFICTNRSNFEPGKECKVVHHNRVIYSESQDYSHNDIDNWRVFKANSYYDFQLSLGKIISVDGIENDKVLARLENGAQLFAAYNLIQTDAENIQVGTGGIFKSRPQDFAVTDLGYAGSQHRSLLNTEFGHVWVDAKRSNIFNLGSGASSLNELSKDGMSNWFRENLAFTIQRDFNLPQEVIDNNYNNIGLHLAFDRRFNRLLLTKLDYKVINPNVKFDTTTNNFYVLVGGTKVPVSVKDKKYFCDKSFTLSYNFFTKAWVSYHSYKPQVYLSHINSFDSITDSKVWAHSVTNKSYQVFGGILYPFVIEYSTDPSPINNLLHSVSYNLDVIRYHNSYDKFYNDSITFNKAIVYNERQCSGLLELIKSDTSNLSQLSIYPKQLPDRTQILVSNSDNHWKFNNFYDLYKGQNIPMFLQTCGNDYKNINPHAIHYYTESLNRNRMRGTRNKICLINDKYSNYHFIFNFAITSQRTLA